MAAYTGKYRGRYDSHSEWVEQRRRRITGKSRIEVTLDNFKVKSHQGNSAIVDFEQSYRSDNYNDRVVKRTALVFEAGSWKIKREVTLAVL